MRAILLPLLLGACAAAGPPSEGAILAIGDSVMAWNGDRGIPEAVAVDLGRPVVDASQSGAQLTHPSRLAGAVGLDISRQFEGGDWSWVILTGGGNDLRRDCGTPAEAVTLDGLIASDLTGDLPSLVARIRATGARVAYVGYYDGAEAEPTAFTACQGAFDLMNARLQELAARDAGLLFVDAGTVIDTADIGLYDGDRIHPSPRGSATIGRAIARAIERFEQAR